MTVASLLLKLGDADPASEGLTLSGGELLQQPDAVAELAPGWRTATGTGVMIDSGVTKEKIQNTPTCGMPRNNRTW